MNETPFSLVLSTHGWNFHRVSQITKSHGRFGLQEETKGLRITWPALSGGVVGCLQGQELGLVILVGPFDSGDSVVLLKMGPRSQD